MDFFLRKASQYHNHAIPIHALPNIKNKSCILIGQGPSLLSHLQAINQSVSLNGSIIFACNTYFYCKNGDLPIPNFYVLGDPVFQNDKYISNLTEIFSSIVNRYPGINFLTSSNIAKHIYLKLLPSNSAPCRIIYAPFGDHLIKNTYSFRLDINIEPYQNILLLMIQFAVYLGFADLHLYGFDLTMSHNPLIRTTQYFDQVCPYKWAVKPIRSPEQITYASNLLDHQIRLCLKSAFCKGVKVTRYS